MFTFWEGRMPDYIRLCMKTWKTQFTVLDYDNIHNYTDLTIEKLKRFTLPQQADCVRVHVLRDQGGYWMDADTIMITGQLPDTDMVGDPQTRENTIGLLYSEPNSEMFREWAKYQDEIINGQGTPTHWDVMGNAFSDPYVKQHKDVRIYPVRKFWPETYMIQDNCPRYNKYLRFYFEEHHNISDIEQTDILMLHNSWTPDWYKRLSTEEVLEHNCTLSNILREKINAIKT